MDDVILNKVASIERCVQQIRTFYEGHEDDFATSHLRQDAIILNIQRACEQSIDLANHIVRIKQLGLPKTSKDAFSFLHESAIIDNDLRQRLQAMVGFRNIAVHNYQEIDLDIVKHIIQHHLTDFEQWTRIALGLIDQT